MFLHNNANKRVIRPLPITSKTFLQGDAKKSVATATCRFCNVNGQGRCYNDDVDDDVVAVVSEAAHCAMTKATSRHSAVQRYSPLLSVRFLPQFAA